MVELSYTNFIDLHKNQLLSSGVPQIFWQTLFNKLTNMIFDAGTVFQLIKLQYDEEKEVHEPTFCLQAIEPIKSNDSANIFLIDHAWTYRINTARSYLTQYENLRSRLANMLGIATELSTEALVDEIFEQMWRINNYYSVGNAQEIEDRLPVWYINDEIGTAIIHSDTPNCRLVPFVYVNDEISYSLLFPITDIVDDFITRDFMEGVTDPVKRKTLLLPWKPTLLKNIEESLTVPDDSYYLSGHIKESVPNLENFKNIQNINENKKLKVYSEYKFVNKFLNDESFEFTSDPQCADILWYVSHFKDFESLSETPNKYINQFPFEYILTVKDLLCATCRFYKDLYKGTPAWLLPTYNLRTEVEKFVSYYQKRETQCLDNYWIVKPYNLARSMDIHITKNLNYILRLSATGPKIVQKYITNPVLFYFPECGKVKFDVRYVILLKNIKPLEAYIYKEFFLRFANKPFELNEFDVYEKHFTVMNYNSDVVLKHKKCKEFLLEWEVQYSDHLWSEVEKKIMTMLREILECATKERPPRGIPESPQSKALYAADIMLEWAENNQIQPKILEINFMPDCARACDYYPDFYNNIFRLLFLNQKSSHFRQL